MEIRVLRYFLTVVREEGINREAEVLHITQPTLSRQLSQLEEEVGVKLFHRGAKKIALTNEGILLRRRENPYRKSIAGNLHHHYGRNRLRGGSVGRDYQR